MNKYRAGDSYVSGKHGVISIEGVSGFVQRKAKLRGALHKTKEISGEFL
jgi:hypothetical protein